MDALTKPLSTDEELTRQVKLAQRGDESAFAELIELTQVRLYRFCVFLTHHPQLAQDLCQDTYVKALEKIGSLREPERFLSWLLKTAKHLFLDYVKSRKNHNVSDTTLEESAAPVTHAEDRELAIEIQKALAQLKPEESLVILLVDLEGHSYLEASEIIGITENALRSRVHRAREAFAKVYPWETNSGLQSSGHRK